MKICIVGRFPPPIGGVSVYMSRRYGMLDRAGEDVCKIDFSGFKWIFKLIVSRADRYEVNTLSLYIVALFFLIGKISKAVFVDHNASRHYSGKRKKILLRLLAKSEGIWVVNNELKRFYPDSFNTEVVSPFVPPDTSMIESIWSTYPDRVINFVSEGTFAVNSAWKYIPGEEDDLYGIETSLQLLDEIPNLRLLLVLGISLDSGMPEYLSKNIERHTKAGRLCFLIGQKELWPIFTKQAISLRLTPVDGDSVSVREALHFGCKVIASDSVSRPDGCLLYQYGDMFDLIDKVSRTLDQ